MTKKAKRRNPRVGFPSGLSVAQVAAKLDKSPNRIYAYLQGEPLPDAMIEQFMAAGGFECAEHLEKFMRERLEAAQAK